MGINAFALDQAVWPIGILKKKQAVGAGAEGYNERMPHPW